ncbi:hypothetical protein O6H91_21G039500 [Diphasiastrum complanatum]|uniref:Uncharacterized protein n=1 Tax=Diphasiastrum complanatum TaxID=34168 RepID=A0ACC2AJP9_DIPCM|nr:hypothetical protein O6H91_21G039500 [Diphasiastrum complanatum]
MTYCILMDLFGMLRWTSLAGSTDLQERYCRRERRLFGRIATRGQMWSDVVAA